MFALRAHVAYNFSALIDHYNWQTARDWTGCRLLHLTLPDGTRLYAVFRF